ncbi:MAG: isoleucine--tRNA ligase [Verrucomicrobiota bacterium]
MAQDLKDTLQLPRTDFPMRANLVQREPARVAHWEQFGLYAALQKKHAAAPVFVLHDGPPFTNGDVHIGTALNKVLKDVINRYKSMRGFRTPYVPGWDCHGLPIEQKVSREIREENLTLTTAGLRARCDAFSEKWIATQTTQFKRLGVLADWKNEYKTKAPAFEADILRTFAAFVEQGLVYRSKKPVYWSIPFETALAEAEIEYRDHISPSIWVKFAVLAEEARKFGLPADKPLFVVIWTTTPWTIPANLAIALHPEVDYVVADLGAERIIVAHALLGSVTAAAKLEVQPSVCLMLPGARLEKLAPRHPFIDRASPVVLADYVTTDSGTGCVHTAPGHGAEDYLTGLKYKLPIYCPVGGDGRYLDDGQIPADLVGCSCLESVENLAAKKTSAANIVVLKKLAAAGALLAKQNLTHSYPHCWRSKTPIIFRAVDQWFVSLDKGQTRIAALAEIDKIAANQGWIPASGEGRIRSAVESRPDWCISRQRAWGVPIIAFYDEKKAAYLDAGVIRAVADKIAVRGSNFWFDATPVEILDGVPLPADWPAPAALTGGRDTLDVWIDSGSSHASVLKHGQGGTHWPADLYLEGSDQHRGWFQSSLWTSVIAFKSAPYRSVLTHGFIVGKDGKKISKSGQYEKPPTSDNYVAQYGADVIRLWIASQDFREDIRVSDLDKDLKNPGSILNVVGEAYRLLRNTLRYQLSTLCDFTLAENAVALSQMDALDRWALHQTAMLIRDCTAAYDACEFHRVYQLCNQFCSVTLSATYHDILKDRLYTLAANSRLRRSAQTAIYHIFDALVKILAPILTFTSDEAWSFASTRAEFAPDSVLLQDWPIAPAEWTDETLHGEFATLLRLRSALNEALEPLRKSGNIGKSLDAVVTIRCPATQPIGRLLRPASEGGKYSMSALAEILLISEVKVQPSQTINQSLPVSHDSPSNDNLGVGPVGFEIKTGQEAGHARCPRCWRWVPELVTAAEHLVCSRCAEALIA